MCIRDRFSHWQNQKIYENARYESIVEENQIIARSLLTFGLHVHVGVPNPERAIQIMNAIRYLLPHVLALSTSSPFWPHHKMLIEENKWRALRYGLDGKMIDFGKGTEVPVRELIRELLEFVDDVVDDLRSRKEIRHIHTILERGTSADDQLRVWRETGDVKAVVDRLIEMTMENVPREVLPRPNHSVLEPLIV